MIFCPFDALDRIAALLVLVAVLLAVDLSVGGAVRLAWTWSRRRGRG